MWLVGNVRQFLGFLKQWSGLPSDDWGEGKIAGKP